MSSAIPAATTVSDPARQFLRHTIATLAYRGAKAMRGAPEGFSTFSCGCGCRAPGEVLAHIGDLLDWALSLAEGRQKWSNSQPQLWHDEVKRFHVALAD